MPVAQGVRLHDSVVFNHWPNFNVFDDAIPYYKEGI